MTDHEPLPPDIVDALLSAELDGALADAARDLGMGAADAAARLRATPGVTERRAALARARELLGAQPPISSSVEDRLVGAALGLDELAVIRARRGRRERQWRVLVATGSVAAAIAVIVGIAALTGGSSSDKQSLAATGTTRSRDAAVTEGQTDGRALAPAPAARPDLGDVTDAQRMRAPARALLSQPPAGGGTTTQSSAKLASPRSGPGDAVADGSASSPNAYMAALPACRTGSTHYEASPQPAVVATGSVSGAPVVILIYAGAGKPYADVVRVGDCTLVRRQPLR